MNREEMLYENDLAVLSKEIKDEMDRYKARLIRESYRLKQKGKNSSNELRECKRELAKLNNKLKVLSRNQQHGSN